jgi:hypothetical protein
VEKEVVLVGDATENPAALDSRQAAAKRADRDRRAVHAPLRSPSELARFCSTLSVRSGRRWQVDPRRGKQMRGRAGATLQERRLDDSLVMQQK